MKHTGNLRRIGGHHEPEPKALIPGLELFELFWKHFNLVYWIESAANDLLITYLRAEAVVLTA